MTTVVEVVEDLRSRGKRELLKDGVRLLESNQADFALYGLVTLALTFAAMNTLLLLQVAGYSPTGLERIFDLFKVGIYGFLTWMTLSVATAFAGIAVEHWDDQEVKADG